MTTEPGTYDTHNMPPVPAVVLDDPETPSVIDAFAFGDFPNLWDSVATTHDVAGEHPEQEHATPMLPGEQQNARTVESVGVSAATARTHVVVHHVMETVDRPAQLIRPRTVNVDPTGHGTAAAVPTPILDYNPNRRRAIIKVLGTAQLVFLSVGRGGGGATAGQGLANAAAFSIATGDPPLEVKAASEVYAYLNTAGPCTIAVWEELNGASTGADLSFGGTAAAL